MKIPFWIVPALLVGACQPEAEKTAATGDLVSQEEGSEGPAPEQEAPEAKFDVNDADTLVGQALEKVKPALEAAGTRYRVVEKDGESFPVTMDFMPERLNFKIKDGIIIAVSKG